MMQLPVLAKTLLPLLLAGLMAINGLAGLNHMDAHVIDAEYTNNQIIYYLEVKDGKEKVPVKVVFRKSNKIKISYKKNGNDVEFSYEREGNGPISAYDKELVDTVKNEMLKHSNGWLRRSGGKVKDLLTDFRDTMMRKPTHR